MLFTCSIPVNKLAGKLMLGEVKEKESNPDSTEYCNAEKCTQLSSSYKIIKLSIFKTNRRLFRQSWLARCYTSKQKQMFYVNGRPLTWLLHFAKVPE